MHMNRRLCIWKDVKRFSFLYQSSRRWQSLDNELFVMIVDLRLDRLTRRILWCFRGAFSGLISLFSSSHVAATNLYYEAISLCSVICHRPDDLKSYFLKITHFSNYIEARLLFHLRESGFFLVHRELKIKMKFFANVSRILDDIFFTSFVLSRKSRRARSKKNLHSVAIVHYHLFTEHANVRNV